MAKIQDMTPDVMKTVVTPELLRESCQKYQKELLQMPFMVFQDQTAKYITVLPGIRNQLTFGELDGDAELGPWSKDGNHKDAEYEIKGRTLEVYPGNCSRDFDPMPLFHSIYGEALASGMNEISAGYVARKLVALFAAKIGKHINDVIFVGGKRNKNGHTTADLFDSFDTIIEKEINSGEDLATGKGNLIHLGTINKTNATEVLKEYYRSADPNLRGQKTFMYMSPEVYWAYVDDYQVRHGALPYNKEFEKTFLEGSQNKCEFAVLDNMAGSNFLKISTKPNFLLGTDIMGQENHVGIAKYKSWVITFEFAGVYGAQIRTLSKEALHVGALDANPDPANVAYNFTSFSADGNTQLATGVAKTTGKSLKFNGVKYVEIVVTQNSVEGWAGRKFYIISNASADGTTKYDLYDEKGNTVGVKVAVTAAN